MLLEENRWLAQRYNRCCLPCCVRCFNYLPADTIFIPKNICWPMTWRNICDYCKILCTALLLLIRYCWQPVSLRLLIRKKQRCFHPDHLTICHTNIHVSTLQHTRSSCQLSKQKSYIKGRLSGGAVHCLYIRQWAAANHDTPPPPTPSCTMCRQRFPILSVQYCLQSLMALELCTIAGTTSDFAQKFKT